MNRYERLFGDMYSHLVEDLSNKMSTGKGINIVVASVLLFKSFNESLYYVGTHANPLLMPHEALASDKSNIKTRKYLTPLCLWYLAAYFCSKWGRTQIDKIFEENNYLAQANASTFALTYPQYAELKEAWKGWLRDNSTNSWGQPPDNLEGHPVVRQSFILSNLLLITMPITGSHKRPHAGGDNSRDKINNASDICNLIMGGDPSTSRWIDDRGKFKTFQSEPFVWRYVKPSRKQLTYGELLNVIEFALIQPVSGGEKESVLQRFVNNTLNSSAAFDPPEFKMSALARPLFYNCEFQGIIYVVRKHDGDGTGFGTGDAEVFERIIKSLHIESRLAESRYDLAQIALLLDEAQDTNSPSLFRILNILHLFSSASSAIALYEDKEHGLVAWERYRVGIGPGTEMKTIGRKDASDIKELIESEILTESRRPAWFFNNGNALDALCTLPSNGEKTVSKSAIVISLLNEEKPSYFVLFFREANDIVNSYCFDDEESGCVDDARNIYAERLYNALERLIDADREHKRMLTAVRERNRLKAHDLSLMTPHTAKNSFNPQVVQPLAEALKLIQDTRAKKRVEAAMLYAMRFAEQANRVSMAWRHILKLQDIKVTDKGIPDFAISVTPRDFQQICDKMKNEHHTSERNNIFCRVRQKEGAVIPISKDILEYLIDQLLANAVEASSEQGVAPEQRRFEIRWTENTNGSNSGSPVTVHIAVWNANTELYKPSMEYAGNGPMINVPSGHSGLGFYFLESALSQLDAITYRSGKHFDVQNTQRPNKGVKVEFSLPAKLVQLNYA